MKGKNILVQTAIVLLIIVVANLISSSLYFRLDFTEDQRFTFSKATRDVLSDLDGVITIKAYFSEDLPPQLLKNRQDFEDQLVEYENRSGGNIVFEFINPNESEELEREAQQQGISPVMINVTERDQVQQLRAYMGAVLKMDDRSEVIPLIQPDEAMEYALTTAIKKISIIEKPKLGFIQGFGETTLAAIPQLMQQLSVLYQVETLNLMEQASVPSTYKALIWLNPTDTVSASDLGKLDAYLRQGGGLFIGYTAVQGDLQTGALSKSPTFGIREWLSRKGVSIGDNFVVDAKAAQVNVQQRQGFFTINSQVSFPYFPMTSNFAKHPVTNGLENVMLPFVTNLSFTAVDTTYRQVPLVYSSEQTGFIAAPSYIDIQRRWTQADFTAGSQLLAAGLDNGTSRIVVVGNGSFCVNGEGQRPQQQTPDNINLAANSIDWIADDTGLIDLRTKGITSRPLDQIEDGTRDMLKYGNVFAPILLILIYALIRKQMNVRKRQKWMQGDYR